MILFVPRHPFPHRIEILPGVFQTLGGLFRFGEVSSYQVVARNCANRPMARR